jgi:hypothetical protein
MFKSPNDGRYRLEFLFSNGGVGWLVTDDRKQVDSWWDIFKKPSQPEIIVTMALFDNNNFVKDHRHELPVAA